MSPLLSSIADRLSPRQAANKYYSVPGDKEKLFYDFYAAEQLSFLTGYNDPNAAHRQYDEGDSDLASAKEAVTTVTTHLKTELQRNIFQAVAGELRHYSGTVIDPTLQRFYHDLEGRKKSNLTGLKPGKERLQANPEFAKDVGSAERSNAVASALKVTKDGDRASFMQAAQGVFSDKSGWHSSFGGKPWAQIAAAWEMLDKAKTNPELFVAIDHVLDLEHNNATFFDKIPTYQKDNGYDWVRKMLDTKYNASLPEILQKCSSQMRSIVQRVAKRINPNLLRDSRKERQPESSAAEPLTKKTDKVYQPFKVGDAVTLKGFPPGVVKEISPAGTLGVTFGTVKAVSWFHPDSATLTPVEKPEKPTYLDGSAKYPYGTQVKYEGNLMYVNQYDPAKNIYELHEPVKNIYALAHAPTDKTALASEGEFQVVGEEPSATPPSPGWKPKFKVGDTVNVINGIDIGFGYSDGTYKVKIAAVDLALESYLCDTPTDLDMLFSEDELSAARQASTTLNPMRTAAKQEEPSEQSTIDGYHDPKLEYTMKFFVEADDMQGSTRGTVQLATDIARAIRDYPAGDCDAARANIISEAKKTGLTDEQEKAIDALLLRWQVPIKVKDSKVAPYDTEAPNSLEFKQRQVAATTLPLSTLGQKLVDKVQTLRAASTFIAAATHYEANKASIVQAVRREQISDRIAGLLKASFSREEVAAAIPLWSFPEGLKREAMSKVLPRKLALSGPRIGLSNDRRKTTASRRDIALTQIALNASEAGLEQNQVLRLAMLRDKYQPETPFWIERYGQLDNADTSVERLEAEGYTITSSDPHLTKMASSDGSHTVTVTPSTISFKSTKTGQESSFGPKELGGFLRQLPNFKGTPTATKPVLGPSGTPVADIVKQPDEIPVRKTILRLIGEGKTTMADLMAELRVLYPHRKPANMRGQVWLELNKDRYPKKQAVLAHAKLTDGRILTAMIAPDGTFDTFTSLSTG